MGEVKGEKDDDDDRERDIETVSRLSTVDFVFPSRQAL